MSDYRTHTSAPDSINGLGRGFGNGRRGGLSIGEFGFGDDGEGPTGPFGSSEPWEIRDHFRLFNETGWELKHGARSLNEVAKVLLRRRKERRYPADLPSAASSMSLAHEAVSEFFGLRYFQIGRSVELFITRGKGWPSTGLSALGDRAWRVTRIWLVYHGYVIDENG